VADEYAGGICAKALVEILLLILYYCTTFKTTVFITHLTTPTTTSSELAELAVKGMLEKKAHDIAVLDLREVKNAIADYFVICSGNSDTQVDAITDSIEEEVFKACGQHAWHKEGFQNKEWILLDYLDVVCHVFTKEKRAFYDLEEFWGDAKIQHIEMSRS
jgi:ribosome-associated protein